MLELQRIRFAGWGLTKGQHRPKAGKKKKTREAGLFFLVPASLDASSGSGLTQRSPTGRVYLSSIFALSSKLYVDRRRSPGLGVFSAEGGSKRITTYPVQVPVLRYSSACKTMFRCRFLASYSGHTYDIQRPCQACLACRKWCLNEKVELLCKLAMPCLSSGV